MDVRLNSLMGLFNVLTGGDVLHTAKLILALQSHSLNMDLQDQFYERGIITFVQIISRK